MRGLLISQLVALTVSIGAAGAARAAADDEAPCIGENASTFAPALGEDFGRVVVAPEAQAGLTGEVASGAARESCD